MTDRTYDREAEVSYVDTQTCVHRLLPITPPAGRYVPSPAAQCPRQPEFLVAGYPSCGQHVAVVITWEHQRGNADVVVRRWL